MEKQVVSGEEFLESLERMEQRASALWYRSWPVLRWKCGEDSLGWWILYGIKQELKHRYSRTIGWFQRALTGYSEPDWWNLTPRLSGRAAHLLKTFRDKSGGMPSNFGCSSCRYEWETKAPDKYTPWDCPCKPFERWKETIDDMIFFHTIFSGLDNYRDFLDLNDEEKHRYRRGKWAFFKYYEGLWD